MGTISLRRLLIVLLVISQYNYGIATLVLSCLLILFILLIDRDTPILMSTECKIVSAIFFIGFFSGLIGIVLKTGSNVSYFLRDGYYFIQPVLIIFLGNLLVFRPSFRLVNFLIIVLQAITIVSLVNIVKIPFLIDSMAEFNFYAREYHSFSNSYSVVGLAILYYYSKKLFFKKRTIIFYALVLLSSLAVSFSRTEYLIALLIPITSYLSRLKLSGAALVSFFSIAGVVLVFGANVDMDVAASGSSTFFDKVMRSVPELGIADVGDIKAASFSWRGYEAFLGLQKYLDGNLWQMIFGGGFSTLVNVPGWVFSDDFMTNIPFFHNGYVTILLKSGVFGLGLFLYFLFRISKHKLCFDDREANLRLFLVFALAVSTLLTHGIYYKRAPFIMLFLVGILFKPQKMNITNQQS